MTHPTTQPANRRPTPAATRTLPWPQSWAMPWPAGHLIRRSALWLSIGVLLFGAGCGGHPTPADAAPELATRLERVDDAIAAGDYDQARTAVTALVMATGQAEDAGDITGDQADQILAAAAELLAQLPDTSPAEPSASDTATEPTSTPDEPEEQDKDNGKDKGKDNGKDNGKDKGKESGKDSGKDKGKGSGKGKRKGHGNGAAI